MNIYFSSLFCPLFIYLADVICRIVLQCRSKMDIHRIVLRIAILLQCCRTTSNNLVMVLIGTLYFNILLCFILPEATRRLFRPTDLHLSQPRRRAYSEKCFFAAGRSYLSIVWHYQSSLLLRNVNLHRRLVLHECV